MPPSGDNRRPGSIRHRCPPHSRVDIWTHGLTGAEQRDSINAEDLLLPAEVGPPGGG